LSPLPTSRQTLPNQTHRCRRRRRRRFPHTVSTSLRLSAPNTRYSPGSAGSVTKVKKNKNQNEKYLFIYCYSFLKTANF